MRACCRRYGVRTEIASLFATFGIFNRHKYSANLSLPPAATMPRIPASHASWSMVKSKG
jgi:hypothetical protein